RELSAALHRHRRWNGDDLIDEIHIDGVTGEFGNEIGTPTLDRVRFPGWMPRRWRAVRVSLLGRFAGDHRRIGRFRQNDLYVRALLGEHTSNALQSAAGSEAGHPVIEPPAGEVVHDLSRCRARVIIRVRFTLE